MNCHYNTHFPETFRNLAAEGISELATSVVVQSYADHPELVIIAQKEVIFFLLFKILIKNLAMMNNYIPDKGLKIHRVDISMQRNKHQMEGTEVADGD